MKACRRNNNLDIRYAVRAIPVFLSCTYIHCMWCTGLKYKNCQCVNVMYSSSADINLATNQCIVSAKFLSRNLPPSQNNIVHAWGFSAFPPAVIYCEWFSRVPEQAYHLTIWLVCLNDTFYSGPNHETIANNSPGFKEFGRYFVSDPSLIYQAVVAIRQLCPTAKI